MNAPLELTEQELEEIREGRLERAKLDLERLGLSEEYLTAFHANPSASLPYHGNQHQLAVASLALRGNAASYGLQEKRPALFIAGLFHDYGYWPGASEETNIARAVTAARALTERLNPELTKWVVELIRATEFPHRRPATQSEAIIQDADLLMIALPDFGVFLEGLKEERPGFEPDPHFPGEAALKTNWAKRVYSTAWAMQFNGERIIDPLAAASVGNTLHLQRMCSKGFLVDSSIADELEQLWAAGYQTLYSCGGDEELPSPGYEFPVSGYIAFTAVTEKQLEVLERAAIAAERPLEYYYPDDGPRHVVRFDAKRAQAVFAVLLRG